MKKFDCLNCGACCRFIACFPRGGMERREIDEWLSARQINYVWSPDGETWAIRARCPSLSVNNRCWLHTMDENTKPLICKAFENGGEACRKLREIAGVEQDAEE